MIIFWFKWYLSIIIFLNCIFYKSGISILSIDNIKVLGFLMNESVFYFDIIVGKFSRDEYFENVINNLVFF